MVTTLPTRSFRVSAVVESTRAVSWVARLVA
jgi:hypothetical protein